MTKITRSERVSFSAEKTLGVVKWLTISGVLSFALTEALRLISKSGEGLDWKDYIPLILSAVINVALFAISKYVEGRAPVVK